MVQPLSLLDLPPRAARPGHAAVLLAAAVFGGMLLATAPARAQFGKAYEFQALSIDASSRRGHGLGDVTGDGRPDLVVAGFRDIGVLPARRTGGFESPVTIGVDFGIERIHLQDIDGDGLLDLLVAGYGDAGPRLETRRGRSGGGFESPVPREFPDPNSSLALEIGPGDFDGDGRSEYLLRRWRDDAFFRGTWPDGGSAEAPPDSVPVPPAWTPLLVQDVDGDGRSDIVFSVSGSGLGIGYGAATDPLRRFEFVGSRATTVRDVVAVLDGNGDGALEFLALGPSRMLELLAPAAGGGLEVIWHDPTLVREVSGILAEDVDGDGDLDIVAFDESGRIVFFEGGSGSGFRPGRPYPAPSRAGVLVRGPWGSGGVPVLVAVGNSGIASYSDWSESSRRQYLAIPRNLDPELHVAADLTNRGTPDLLLFARETDDAGVLLIYVGEGDRRFGPPIERPLGIRVRSAVVRDVTGDGLPDLVALASRRTAIWLYPGTGDDRRLGPGRVVGSTIEPSDAREPDFRSLEVEDLDGDGIPDLLVTSARSGRLEVLPGRRDGTFGTPGSFPFGEVLSGVRIADLDPRPGPEILVQAGIPGEIAVLAVDRAGIRLLSRQTTFSRSRGPFLAAMDADCLDDIVVLTESARMAWMQNLGGGRYAEPASAQLGIEYDEVSVTDVTGDGRPDLVLNTLSPGIVTVHPGAVEGGFRPPEESALGGSLQLRFPDLDGDGAPDLVGLTGDGSELKLIIAWNDGSLRPTPQATARSPLRVLSPTPNPSRGRTVLNFEGLAVGESYEFHILDVQGRLVHARSGRASDPEHLCLRWDGEAEGGRRASEGIYFARLSTPRGSVTTRIVRVP